MRNKKSLHNLCRNKMSEQFKGKNATLKVRDQQIGESYDSRPTLWMGRPGRWRGLTQGVISWKGKGRNLLRTAVEGGHQ